MTRPNVSAAQCVVSINEFARAALEADSGFSGRVREFEGRFGTADADTLAVLAQAAHLCWFHASYEANLLAACRAIAAMKPTPFSHCCQISPARWIQMDAYVIGVQAWLGLDLRLPSEIDKGLIERIGAWLGERSSTKNALAALFLCQLVDHLVFRVSFATMGGEATSASAPGVPSHSGAYADYTPWYARPDGAWYSTGDDYDDPPDRAEVSDFVRECKGRVRQGALCMDFLPCSLLRTYGLPDTDSPA